MGSNHRRGRLKGDDGDGGIQLDSLGLTIEQKNDISLLFCRSLLKLF